MNNKNREIEVRFLGIDIEEIVNKLNMINAIDLGSSLIKEIIFYDKDNTWSNMGKFVRLRRVNNKSLLSYKQHQSNTINGTLEIEFEVSDFNKTKQFLEEIGLIAFRDQEKKRHSFTYGNSTIDIDTWPSIPTYIEIEGESEDAVRATAKDLDLNWNDAIFENAKIVIEKYYNIPVSTYKYFTFDKIE